MLWFLGYPDQAQQRNHAALTLAQELSHPYNLALALNFAGLVHQYRREEAAVQERAEALLALSSEQGFALWVAVGTITRGWALATQEQVEEGIRQIRQGMAAYQAMGTKLGQQYHFALLAEAYGKGGQVEEGLTMLNEVLAIVDNNGERWYEGELYRLKGQLTLQSQTSLGQVSDKSKTSRNKSEILSTQPLAPSTQEAEACFHKAIEIARKQQAKSLELRATVSLARLWQQQDKKEEARQVLAEVYGWFTEGFDTADLKEAKALLAELGE
jgi:predicted ATPase